LLVGSFDEPAVAEHRVGSRQGDEAYTPSAHGQAQSTPDSDGGGTSVIALPAARMVSPREG
jgi:hypothetical protein